MSDQAEAVRELRNHRWFMKIWTLLGIIFYAGVIFDVFSKTNSDPSSSFAATYPTLLISTIFIWGLVGLAAQNFYASRKS